MAHPLGINYYTIYGNNPRATIAIIDVRGEGIRRCGEGGIYYGYGDSSQDLSVLDRKLDKLVDEDIIYGYAEGGNLSSPEMVEALANGVPIIEMKGCSIRIKELAS